MSKFGVEQRGTGMLMRTVGRSVASRRRGDIVALIASARRRGKPYSLIAQWFGPRSICPAEITPLLDRVELLAAVEEGTIEG